MNLINQSFRAFMSVFASFASKRVTDLALGKKVELFLAGLCSCFEGVAFLISSRLS